MVGHLRTAKAGNDWSQADLRAYNIVVEFQDAATFFGVKPLPRPPVANEVLNNVAANDMADPDNYTLLRYMDLAMDTSVPMQESSVDDFAAHLLTVLGYNSRPRMVRKRVEIPLAICGETRNAKTNVCIVDTDNILLIIQEEKRQEDAEPQLVAEAIATFQADCYRRTHVLGQDPITHKVIPGITLFGTFPTFYKIPVTTALAESVSSGIFPEECTIVHAHRPQLDPPARCLSESMKPLDNRASILACYEAFKTFVN